MAGWYKYSGKPKGRLRLPYNVYKNMDVRIPGPPSKGQEHRLIYLNVAPTWKLPKSDPMYWYQTAVIRVRFTRDGKMPNPTAYQSFVMTPWEDTLITHTHWEMGSAGKGGVWSMRVRGHIKDAVVSTRYAKGAMP